ncbi:hypothetical protein HDU96_003592 [Phlyctochytrium bullatum]|nr:hypothetical protein HDU96_003592 [Phlyctochytrium bullatum]
MADLCLAGRADDPDFAKVRSFTLLVAVCSRTLIDKGQAEAMAYHLARNLPDFQVTVTMLTPDDWEEFRDETYEAHRWVERRARDRTLKTLDDLPQIIWRKSGELIGNTADFLRYAKEAYDQELQFDEQTIQEISRENFVSACHSKYTSNTRLVITAQ